MLTCFWAVLLPFLGTTLGALGVFFLKTGISPGKGQCLSGFAGGVMTAASVWSLLIPAMERSAHLGPFAFVPAVLGVWSGFLGLMLLNRRLPLRPGSRPMLVTAVALHNLPEGMAVGVAAALWLAGSEGLSAAAVVTLSLGIAIQNLPEGAIISMPLGAAGMKKGAAFGWGVLSGVIEPLGALLTLALARQLAALLPGLLGFSAGAMLYVVVAELIPELSGEESGGVLSFAGGFTLMMALDVALG